MEARFRPTLLRRRCRGTRLHLHRRVLAFGVMVGLGLATLADTAFAGRQDELASIVERFRLAPSDYERARRIYEFANRPGGARSSALQAIGDLERELPEAHFLEVIRGHLFWSVDPQRAAEHYRRAATRFAAMGDDNGEVIARSNLRTLLWEVSKFDEAQDQLEKLKAIGSQTSDPVAKVRVAVLHSLHQVEQFRTVGRAFRSLVELGKTTANLPYSVERELRLARADVAMTLGEFTTAQDDYRRLLELATQRSDRYTRAFALGALAFVRLEQGGQPPADETASIRGLLMEAIEIAQSLERPALWAWSKARLASLEMNWAGEPRIALEHLDRCIENIEAEHYKVELGYCSAKRAEVKRKLGLSPIPDTVAALELLGGSANYASRLLAWQEVLESAAKELDREAFPTIARAALLAAELLRSMQEGDAARRTVFAASVRSYVQSALVLLENAQASKSDIELAFEIVERSRARNLLDSLNRPQIVRSRIKHFELVLSELTAPTRAVLGSVISDSDEDNQLKSDALAEIQKLADAFERDLFGEKRRFPRIHQIQATLDNDEAMVVYLLKPQSENRRAASRGSRAIVIQANKVRVVSIPADRAQIANAVRLVRGYMKSRKPISGSLRQRLAGKIVKPVLDVLGTGIQHLVIIPDAQIGSCPLQHLIGEHLSYSLSPSAAVWMKGRRLDSKPKAFQGLALVDPEISGNHTLDSDWRFAPSWRNTEISPGSALPFTLEEARAIERYVQGTLEVLSGAEATKDQLLSRWKGSSRNFLHIGSHAIVNNNIPERSGLVLAGDNDSANVLESQEIGGLEFRASVIALSGCSTGVGTRVEGEGSMSLARSFIRGGARAVVASLWPVRDDEGARFFEHFYDAIGRGETLAHAIRGAQTEMKSQGFSPAAYTGFVVIGDARSAFKPRTWWKTLVARPPAWFFAGLAGLLTILGLTRKKPRSPRPQQGS